MTAERGAVIWCVFLALMAATKWCERGGSVAVYVAIAAVLVLAMCVVAYRIDAAIRRQLRREREEQIRERGTRNV